LKKKTGGKVKMTVYFVAGDPVGNFRADIAGAATFLDNAEPFVDAENHPLAQERMDLFSGWMNCQNGPDWKEVNSAVT
jgi:hypothetical protein